MLILDRRLLSVLKGIKGVRSRRGKDVLSPPPSNTFAMPLATFLPFLTYLLGFGQRGKFLCGPFILRSLLFRIALRRAISSKKERKERRRERERAVLFFNLKPVFLLLMKRASKKILKFYYQISSSKEGGKIRLSTLGIPTFFVPRSERELVKIPFSRNFIIETKKFHDRNPPYY